jgi:hypothetical protein
MELCANWRECAPDFVTAMLDGTAKSVTAGIRQTGLGWCACSSPGSQVEAVDYDAEHVGWNKAQLSSLDSDDADNGAIDAGQNPALPTASADQNGGDYGENAGQIIKPKHENDSSNSLSPGHSIATALRARKA